MAKCRLQQVAALLGPWDSPTASALEEEMLHPLLPGVKAQQQAMMQYLFEHIKMLRIDLMSDFLGSYQMDIICCNQLEPIRQRTVKAYLSSSKSLYFCK